MEVVVSRKDQADLYLDKVREICKEMGNPEHLVNKIEEIEKLKDSVDKR
jgi:hypothetical protein